MNDTWTPKITKDGPNSPLEIDAEDLDQECENLFSDTPIRFIPRENSSIDEAINNVINSMRITIPIIWIKDAKYLVGCYGVHMELKNSQVMVKDGNGLVLLQDYVKKHNINA